MAALASCKWIATEFSAKLRNKAWSWGSSAKWLSSQALTVDNLNPCIRRMEYAVRGRIPIEAMRINAELRQGSTAYPFNRVLFANIGDSHAMGQAPLTYTRQLIAACCEPSLIDKGSYPSDVLERARSILEDTGGGSLGAYTDSRGIELIRKDVERFITERDGIDADYNHIYLVNGATDGIRSTILLCLMEGRRAGVMIPIPQYPLYTAAIAELDAHPIGYYLNEDDGWSINIEELQETVDSARKDCLPRVMAVINPGNPTGQYLRDDNVRDIIRFCKRNNLLILADEVYQENLWKEGAKFSSVRKVLLEMGPDYSDVQLVSFNSTSKGYFGECGIRGGYMEMIGFSPELMDEMYKLFSTRLCANSVGQVVAAVMVNPPKEGDPSYQLFNEERNRILSSLKLRANMVYERFNKIPGVFCNPVEGAMYAFPRIDIPEKAWELAKKEDPDMLLDTYYCLEFLRQQGVCVVPGNGFGQKPGTWHFRTTILPSVTDLDDLLNRFEEFHVNFLNSL